MSPGSSCQLRRRLPLCAVLAPLAVALAGVGCKGTTIVGVAQQTDTFTQMGDVQQSESFSQRPGVIDILFVVDDSGSMCTKQEKLASEFSAFITALSGQGLDFHIGVVTTDFSSPHFQGKLVADVAGDRFLTSTTANLPTAFGQIVTAVGHGGSTNSQPLLAAATALQPPLSSGTNAGFLRAQAALAIVVVDDEDDYSLSLPWQSVGLDAGVQVGTTAAVGDPIVPYFDRVLKAIKGPGQDALVTVSAIVGATTGSPVVGATTGSPVAPSSCNAGNATLTSSCPAPIDNSANPAFRILQVVNDTGGLGQSICQSDFTTILTNLGKLLGGLTRQFNLASGGQSATAFNAASITVTVTPAGGTATTVSQDSTNGWSFDASTDTLQFNGAGVPPPGAKIAVGFAALNNTFKLTYVPEPSTLVVQETVLGKSTTIPAATAAAPNGYTYDAAQQAVMFPAALVPPVGATITVTYTTA